MLHEHTLTVIKINYSWEIIWPAWGKYHKHGNLERLHILLNQ